MSMLPSVAGSSLEFSTVTATANSDPSVTSVGWLSATRNGGSLP